jgi:hypothetical protein
MEAPAFIYAFDLLGHDRFVGLCGLLLAERFRGFFLGGVGPDQGVDGIAEPALGTWMPEAREPLLEQVVRPGETVVFQFKHLMVCRAGEARAREQLLHFYQGKNSELRKPFVEKLEPKVYVLVTNVEVNNLFREKLVSTCRDQCTTIEHFLVIGLDELESWIRLNRDLRTLYFPTLFGPARFNLRILIMTGERIMIPPGNRTPLFQIKVANIGASPSYISSIILCALSNDGVREFHLVEGSRDYGALEPGRAETHHIPYDELFQQLSRYKADGLFPAYVRVVDEVGNSYEEPVPTYIREQIINGITLSASARNLD